MQFKTKIKIDHSFMFAAFVFYIVVSTICFAILVVADFRLIHIGIIGILSLISAFGLFKQTFWALWVVIVHFFIATTFSTVMIYYVFGEDLLFSVILVVYLFLSWIFTVYTVSKRKTLKIKSTI